MFAVLHPARRQWIRERRWRKGLESAVLCVLILSIPSLCPAAVTVNYAALGHGPNNPRFFIHGDELSDIRERIAETGTSNYTLFQQWKAHMDYFIGRNDPGYMIPRFADDMAAMYLLTLNTSYADRAISIAMDCAQQSCYDISDPRGYGPGLVSTTALVYDWCYDRLTDTQRQTLRNRLAISARDIHAEYHHHTEYMDIDNPFGFSFAIVEDAPTYGTITNADVRSYFEAYLNELRDDYCPCLDAISPNGYTEEYPVRPVNHLVLFVRSIRGLADWDPMSSSWIANIPRSWNARFLPDKEWQRTVSKYNYSDADPYWLFSIFGSYWQDQTSQGIVEAIANSHSPADMGDPWWGYDLYLYFFFHDPSALAVNLNAMQPNQTDYYDSGAGVYMGRSGYHFGPTSTDVLTGFFCGPFAGGSNTGAQPDYDSDSIGHYYISRGGDVLLCGSGAYNSELDGHFDIYYDNTVANNTLLIQHPGAPLLSWNDCHNHPTSFTTTDIGVQEHGSVPRGAAQWPECGASTPTYKGMISRFAKAVVQPPPLPDDSLTTVMIDADMSALYTTRATSVVRSYQYYRPDWVLVRDRIVFNAGSIGDTIRVLLHCVNRPQVDGDSTLMAGTFAHGGVYRKTGATRAIINQGSSSARVYFLGVRGGDNEQVRIVGGTNSVGAGWRQSHDSAMTDGYSPGNPSFEFWVGGKNLVPMMSGCLVGPYSYEVRNTSPRAGGYKDNPACDWRLEYLARATSQTVILATLIHATTAGAGLNEVTISGQGDGERVEFTDGASRARSVAPFFSSAGGGW